MEWLFRKFWANEFAEWIYHVNGIHLLNSSSLFNSFQRKSVVGNRLSSAFNFIKFLKCWKKKIWAKVLQKIHEIWWPKPTLYLSAAGVAQRKPSYNLNRDLAGVNVGYLTIALYCRITCLRNRPTYIVVLSTAIRRAVYAGNIITGAISPTGASWLIQFHFNPHWIRL